MLNLITESQEEGQGFVLTLDEIARDEPGRCSYRLCMKKFADYIVRHSELKDDHGRP